MNEGKRRRLTSTALSFRRVRRSLTAREADFERLFFLSPPPPPPSGISTRSLSVSDGNSPASLHTLLPFSSVRFTLTPTVELSLQTAASAAEAEGAAILRPNLGESARKRSCGPLLARCSPRCRGKRRVNAAGIAVEDDDEDEEAADVVDEEGRDRSESEEVAEKGGLLRRGLDSPGSWMENAAAYSAEVILTREKPRLSYELSSPMAIKQQRPQGNAQREDDAMRTIIGGQRFSEREHRRSDDKVHNKSSDLFQDDQLPDLNSSSCWVNLHVEAN